MVSRPDKDKSASKRKGRARRSGRRWILGLGLDGKDGHVRLTRGKNFHLVGGSQDTHGEMQEKMIRLNEELDRRHKTLDTVSVPELDEIASRIGLKK